MQTTSQQSNPSTPYNQRRTTDYFTCWSNCAECVRMVLHRNDSISHPHRTCRENPDLESSQTFNSIGWHSVPISFSLNQKLLNVLSLTFTPDTTSGTRQVYAAFLRLTTEPPKHSIYWGAWMDGDVYTKEGEGAWGDAPWDQATWNEFESHAGRAHRSCISVNQPLGSNRSPKNRFL